MVCDSDKLTFNSLHIVQEALLSCSVCYVFAFLKNVFTIFRFCFLVQKYCDMNTFVLIF